MAAKKKSVKKAVKKTVKKKTPKKDIPQKVERELNPKEKSFCENYLIDHNATQAAIRAGYAKNSARVTASRMLSKANILNEIEKLSSIVTEKVLITAEDVARDLIEVKERCMEHVEVKDKKGRRLGIFVFDSKGANQALNRLGDYTGGFTKKLDHTSQGDKIEPTQLYIPTNGR